MRAYHKQDYYLAITTIILVVFGLVMVSSASVVQSYQATGSNNFYFFRQSGFALAGVVAWWFFSKLDYHFWKRWATTLLIIAGILLVLVLIPGIGVESGGARRWIAIAGQTFQASEFAKLAIIVYLAYWFENKGHKITDFYATFLPFVMILVVAFLLIMQQPDLGTAMSLALTAGTMYMVAGATWGQLAALVGTGLGGIFLLIKLEPYRLSRFLTFLNPSSDPLGAGYHINQALLAIGSGGLFGLGYGRSRQKYNFLPETASDSIFAIIGEELGMIGCVALIIGFAIVIWRGLLIARRAPDMFGRMLALGITCWIGYQAVLNMGALVGLFPLTGIPLPFISLGGTSLLMILAASGILLNISKQTIITHKDENLVGGWGDWWSHLTNAGGRKGLKS
ncbi:MAG: putative lipid II flippase FtsW [Patescibacteria group bacterium]|jgi:cell division protein FtsW